MTEAQERLARAMHAVYTASILLIMERETIEAYLKESRNMDNFGFIIDPALYRDPQRRDIDSIVRPIFETAIEFLKKYETHAERAQAALSKISA